MSWLHRRAASGGAAEVRLLLCAAGGVPDALAAAALQLRYEPLALRRPPAPAPAHPDDEEPPAWTRARDALHAHRWPGLHRATAAPPRHPDDTESLGEADAVERAELFADALQVLTRARDLAPDQRRERADALIDAFARALQLPDELQLDGL